MNDTLKCIKCHKPDLKQDDEYCSNCGQAINANFCPNNMCDRNNGEAIPCADTDCYCPDCGEETQYFQDNLIQQINYD